MITLKQAKDLKYGDILHHVKEKNKNKTPLRVRVSGAVKTWKRDPNRIRVPLKYGLYGYGELTNGTWEGSRGFTLHLEDVEFPD